MGLPVEWKARIDHIRDGDTSEATILSGPRKGQKIVNREPGLNTPETGMPGKEQAKALFAQLVADSGMQVKLGALTAGGSLSGGTRERWHTLVYRPQTERWEPASVHIAAAGWAIPFPSKEEWSFNREINEAAQRAAVKGRGLWSTRLVPEGRPDGNFRVRCEYNPAGSDAGAEWVDITNLDAVVRSLAGWSLRDAAAWDMPGETGQRGYIFPAGTQVSPGKTVRLYTGNGTNTADRFYWGRGTEMVFNNENPDTGGGDAAVLVDPVGNYRAWHFWPDLL